MEGIVLCLVRLQRLCWRQHPVQVRVVKCLFTLSLRVAWLYQQWKGNSQRPAANA